MPLTRTPQRRKHKTARDSKGRNLTYCTELKCHVFRSINHGALRIYSVRVEWHLILPAALYQSWLPKT